MPFGLFGPKAALGACYAAMVLVVATLKLYFSGDCSTVNDALESEFHAKDYFYEAEYQQKALEALHCDRL